MIYSFQMMYSHKKKKYIIFFADCPKCIATHCIPEWTSRSQTRFVFECSKDMLLFSVTSHFGNNTTLLCDHLNKHNCFRKHCVFIILCSFCHHLHALISYVRCVIFIGHRGHAHATKMIVLHSVCNHNTQKLLSASCLAASLVRIKYLL